MTNHQTISNSCIIPTLRYRDGQAAIDWLCRVFGFEVQLVVPDKTGAIAHAQLTYGNGMIMLGSATNNEFHELVKSPMDSGRVGSQSVYIMVADVIEHHRKAVAAGAEVVIKLKDEDYGGCGYSCLDLDGHLWNFGSYNPWEQSPIVAESDSSSKPA